MFHCLLSTSTGDVSSDISRLVIAPRAVQLHDSEDVKAYYCFSKVKVQILVLKLLW